jgi:hypothetical protein
VGKGGKIRHPSVFDAIGEVAISDDGLALGPVRIHRVNAVDAQLKKEQTA